ncbi:hypothetical protein FALCPG4_011133 [Fusarium falciforme]
MCSCSPCVPTRWAASRVASRRDVPQQCTALTRRRLDELVAVQSRLVTIRCVRREEDQQGRILTLALRGFWYNSWIYSRDDKQGSIGRASSCALSTYYEARKETPSFQSHIPAILRKDSQRRPNSHQDSVSAP